MAATRPISEVCERYRINRSFQDLSTAVELQMVGYQACHVCAQLEHVFLYN